MNKYVLALCSGIVALAMLLLSGCVVAPQPSDTHPDVRVSGRMVVGDEHAQLSISFSDNDRRHIHDYYYREQESIRNKHNKRKAMPPGLAKRDELPPGLQRQVRRNGELPPGIEGRQLPVDLEQRLSPLPAGYLRLQVGRDIVLMNQRTRVTVDVIKNIFHY